MVFLKATIIRSEEDMAGATGEKYRFIREEQKRAKEDSNYLLDEKILPLLPVWDEVSVKTAEGETQQ